MIAAASVPLRRLNTQDEEVSMAKLAAAPQHA